MGGQPVDRDRFCEHLDGHGRAGSALVDDRCFGRALVLGLNAAILVMTWSIRMAAISVDGRRRGAVPAAKLSTMIIRPPQEGQRCAGVGAVSGASLSLSVRSVAAASAVAASSN